MQLTVDEKRVGGLAAVRALVEAGGSPEQITAFIDTLDVDEDDAATNAPVEVAAEKRGRIHMLPTGHQVLLQEDGGFTIAGNYSPETRRAIARYMQDHPIEPASVVLAEGECPPLPGDGQSSAGDQLVTLMTEGRAPVGGLSLAAEQALARSEGSAQLTIGGMPIPPGESITQEQHQNAVAVGRIVRSSQPTGETTVDNFPVPA